VQKNQLHYGDNLGVLREHIIYLDPPFNSRQRIWMRGYLSCRPRGL
jgi:16S rRNA G966 N2-methylase RsmD